MKTAVFLLFLAVCASLSAGIWLARGYRRTADKKLFRLHRLAMRIVFWLTLGGVVSVEVSIRLGYMPGAWPKFFWIHLVFAPLFLFLAAVLVFWKNGLQSPKLHRKLGYLCIAAFAGTFITGIAFLLVP